MLTAQNSPDTNALPEVSPVRIDPGKGAPSRPEPETAHHDDEVGSPPQPPKPKPSWVALMALIGVGCVVGLFLLGWLPRNHRSVALAREVERLRTEPAHVRAAPPRRSPETTVALLPGDVQPIEEATIYPRTNGYLKRRFVDIGDEVEENQLLAEISTPEIDAQLEQAKAALAESIATLERSKATARLSEITLTRLRALVAKKAVSQQELDESESGHAVAVANVRLAEATIDANRASVRNMEELQSFSKVYAPFDGRITARNIDNGQLVTAGNNAVQSLFRLAKINTVRVFVNVPQMYAPSIHEGLSAELLVREMPGRKFVGKVTRSARAIDPVTRTLLTEIQVPNNDGVLLSGLYVQVKIEVTRGNPPLLIPSSGLMFNADGTQVAVVDAEQHVHIQQVEVEGDFGAEVGIASGLSPEDLVVANPGDRLKEGELVKVVEAEGN